MMGNYACAMAITMQKCSRAAAYRFSGLSNSSGEMFSKLLWLPFPSNSDRVLPFFFFFFFSQVDVFSEKNAAARARGAASPSKKGWTETERCTGASAKVWKRAARRPAERIYEAPAACEGLLPHHHPPVTADDLISPHNGRRAAKENSRACCSAASSTWHLVVFHFFFNYRPMNLSSRVFLVSCNSGIKQQVFVLLFDL